MVNLTTTPDRTTEKPENIVIKIVLILFIIAVNSFASNRDGIDVLDVIDYIKIVDDSIEIKVKTDCYRKILFDTSPSGLYINVNETPVINAYEARRYFDKLLSLSLENYDSKSGTFFNEASPFNIKINTTSANISYHIPSVKNHSFLRHINSILRGMGYRAFYILNQYGTDYRPTKSIMFEDQLLTLTRERVIGFKVKKSGYIYIAKQDEEMYQQLQLKLNILCNTNSGFSLVTLKDATIIVIEPYVVKSSVAP